MRPPKYPICRDLNHPSINDRHPVTKEYWSGSQWRKNPLVINPLQEQLLAKIEDRDKPFYGRLPWNVDFEAIATHLNDWADSNYPSWKPNPNFLLMFFYNACMDGVLGRRAHHEHRYGDPVYNFLKVLYDGYWFFTYANRSKGWMGKHYGRYIDFLVECGYLIPYGHKGEIIQEDIFSGEWTISYKGFKPKRGEFIRRGTAYRICPEHFDLARKRFYKRVAIKDQKTALKIMKALEEQRTIDVERTQLVEYRQELVRMASQVRFDEEASYAFIDRYDLDEEMKDDMREAVAKINDGNFYFKSDLDLYGERLHHSWSTMWSVLMDYIYYEPMPAEPVAHRDNSNSQFQFLAWLLEGKAHQLLDEEEFRKPLALIQEVVFEDDVRRFCQDALAGKLYDKTAFYTGISRDHAKKKWYQLAFSVKMDFRQGKEFMANTYPSIVKLLDQINAKESVLPKMLQRLESRLMLDGVAQFLIDHQIDFLLSIHDSFFYFMKDEPLVEAAFREVFGRYGLQMPHYK